MPEQVDFTMHDHEHHHHDAALEGTLAAMLRQEAGNRMEGLVSKAGGSPILVMGSSDIRKMLDMAVPAEWWAGEASGRGLLREVSVSNRV